MTMTITQEQLDAMLDEATAAGEIRPSASFVDALLGSLGITITPAEPPEMVKLAREAFSKDDNIEEASAWPVYRAAYLAALQHAVNVVKGAPFTTTPSCRRVVDQEAILAALGAGGRNAG